MAVDCAGHFCCVGGCKIIVAVGSKNAGFERATNDSEARSASRYPLPYFQYAKVRQQKLQLLVCQTALGIEQLLMTMKVRKAVFPAAGLGTRFLPATKAQPKEMLPVVDKPIIQYGVEEAMASGCDQILIITGRGKQAIEDHFDVSYELEKMLEERGKTGSAEDRAQDLGHDLRGICPAEGSARAGPCGADGARTGRQ